MFDPIALLLSGSIPLFRHKERVFERNLREVLNRLSEEGPGDDFGVTPFPEQRGLLRQLTYRKVIDNLAVDLSSFIRGKVPPLHPLDRESIEATEALSQGGILLSGHIGLHELVASEIGVRTGKLLSAAAPMQNNAVQRLLDRRRREWQAPAVDLRGRFQEGVAHLRRGGVFGVMIDQDPGLKGKESTFLGVECRTTRLPDLLWHRGGRPPAVVGWAETGSRNRNEPGRLFLRLLPDGTPPTESAERVLEEAVIRRPELWYGWIHRRYKSTLPELYL